MTDPGPGDFLAGGLGRSDSLRLISMPRWLIHSSCSARFSSSVLDTGVSSAVTWKGLGNRVFFNRSRSCIAASPIGMIVADYAGQSDGL